MCSKPQIQHKSTSRPNFAIIPNSFNIKNMPNLTAPSELLENPKLKLKNWKNKSKFGNLGLHRGKLGAP